MKRTVLGFLLLAGLAGGLRGAQAADLTATAKLGGLTVKCADYSITGEEGYVHAMLDLYPSRAALKKLGAKASLKSVAEALVKGPLLKKFPKASAVKVDLVEYTQRDTYGLPVFRSLKPLLHLEGTVGNKGKVAWSGKKAKE